VTWTDPDKNRGFVDFSEFVVTSPHGKYSEGWLSLSHEVLPSLQTGIAVRVSLAKRPEITAEQTFPPSYDCLTPLAFYGPPGQTGPQGAIGQTGDRSSAGTQGGMGGPGGPGGLVVAEVSFAKTPFYPKLLVIRAHDASGAEAWYVGPAGNEPVPVFSAGGAGGTGGQGGMGGSGTMSARGTSEPGSDGSDGGPGGQGGQGGTGGQLKILFDARFPQLRNLVVGKTPGGPGGYGGPGGHPGAGGPGTPSGRSGSFGPQGLEGPGGPAGQPPTYQAVPPSKLFKGVQLQLLEK
jgi:hypothetical protein